MRIDHMQIIKNEVTDNLVMSHLVVSEDLMMTCLVFSKDQMMTH